MTRALESLLIRADCCDGGHYSRVTWFSGCSLVGNVIVVPDEAHAKSIERMFLPKLRAIVSDISVRVQPPATPAPSPASDPSIPKSKTREYLKWKADKTRDLLD